MSAVIGNVEIYIPLDDLLDYKAEYERLQKEKTNWKASETGFRKLSNEALSAKRLKRSSTMNGKAGQV
jgi:valyl-tRNA synthetase